MTYAETIRRGRRSWPANGGRRTIPARRCSRGKRIADGLGLKVGDTLTVNVLGRNISARIANLRSVDWQTLGINFVLVYSPNTSPAPAHAYSPRSTFPRDTTAQQDA